jgi:multiple sugar transport system ATP-binding protein
VPRKAPFEVTEDNTIEGILNEIEPTSTGCAAYLSTPDGSKDYIAAFKLRLPTSYLGQTVPLGINMDKIHLFDARTEKSLLYRD